MQMRKLWARAAATPQTAGRERAGATASAHAAARAGGFAPPPATRVRSRSLVVAVVAALAVLGVTACGSTNPAANPQSVQSALRATAHQSGLQLTLSIEGGASLVSGTGNSNLTEAQKKAITDSRLALTVHAANGTSLANAGNGGELAFALAEGGNTMAELRVVGSTLYAQVDLDQLTTTYGLDKGRVEQFRSQLQQLGSSVSGLSALEAGKWVSVDVNLINQLAQTAGVTLPSAPQLVGRIVGAFFNTLAQSNNIKSTGRNKAEITVNGQQLVTALAQAVASTPGVSSLSKEVGSLAQRAHAAVPANRSATVVATLSGGIVSNLNLSLNQFDTSHKLSGPASINLAVSKSGAVSTPSGATAVNVAQLLHAMASASTSS